MSSVCFWVAPVLLAWAPNVIVRAQAAPQLSPADFAKLAAKITSDRADGVDVTEAVEEQALKLLDSAAMEKLDANPPDIDGANQRLATFVTHQPPVGESYRVVRLAGETPSYALVANFGLSGPSAVRIYSGAPGHMTLIGRVDPFTQKDFFDDYLDLIPVAGADGVFVIVSGRTDDQQTGIFTVWRMDGQRLTSLWSSDILEQSNYDVVAGGIRITYCSETDSNDFRVCKVMQRERYSWQDGVWKRVEQVSAPVPAAGKP